MPWDQVLGFEAVASANSVGVPAVRVAGEDDGELFNWLSGYALRGSNRRVRRQVERMNEYFAAGSRTTSSVGDAGAMATFDRSDELRGARFSGVDLQKARFVGCDLSGVVMRGVEIGAGDIDAPWLSTLRVNGVDVAPYVESELNRRFPGRELRRAEDPAGLREAWAVLEATWARTVERAPAEKVDESVDGEWSFAQTLRHLVLATNTWFGRGIHEQEQPFHPLGLADAGTDSNRDSSLFVDGVPPYEDVLMVRAEHQAMVREYIAQATPEMLQAPRKNPHAPQYPETVLSCLHVILEEEWEHHRYAVRDLDTLLS
ncbi:DinB family protein [Kribbella sp. NPDC051770]|uniref:DinB family protein n=1 Tax=Kribbella sp. NPDC051770 TaxID=3155413 RepID=UPI003443AEB4